MIFSQHADFACRVFLLVRGSFASNAGTYSIHIPGVFVTVSTDLSRQDFI